MENLKKSETHTFIFYGGMLFLVCFFTKLFGFPNKIALLGTFAVCAYYIYIEKKINISLREVLLLLGMLSYTVIAHESLSNIIVITLMPVLFMMAGKMAAEYEYSRKGKEFRIFCLLGVFILGYFVQGFLNSIIYFVEEDAGVRVWADIWGNALPATQHNIFVLPVVSLMLPAVFYWKRFKVLCTGVILSGFFFLFHAIYSLSRIPVLVWGLVLLWEGALFIILNYKNLDVMKYVKKIILAALAVFFFVVILIILNWDQVRTIRFVSRLMSGGGVVHNIRFTAQLNAVRQLFVYPFGGYQMDLAGLEFCHNVWLDIAYAAGVIPFFIICAYTIWSFIDFVRFLRNDEIKPELKYIVSGLYMALMLYFMIETPLMADIRLFVPWTYINGIICGCNVKRQ